MHPILLLLILKYVVNTYYTENKQNVNKAKSKLYYYCFLPKDKIILFIYSVHYIIPNKEEISQYRAVLFSLATSFILLLNFHQNHEKDVFYPLKLYNNITSVIKNFMTD